MNEHVSLYTIFSNIILLHVSHILVFHLVIVLHLVSQPLVDPHFQPIGLEVSKLSLDLILRCMVTQTSLSSVVLTLLVHKFPQKTSYLMPM